MSLSKFLASLLLLLLALCCRTTMEQPLIFPTSPSPSPSPSPGKPAKPGVPREEVYAVNALLRLSKYSGRNINPKEFSATDCGSSDFRGISCDNSSRHVTRIDLSNENLEGNIPAEIGNLPQLISLDLSTNKLSGSIPQTFENLSHLSALYLQNNNLRRPLAVISKMMSLEIVSLHNNLFNESIPPEFGTLPSLRYLSIYNNRLTGTIPIDLGNISSLDILYLDENLLTDKLPPHLGNLSNLQFLYLDDNLLTDKLPPHLGNLSNLQYLSLANNNFFGELPSELGKLEQLLYFDIQGNSFNGTIPDFIGNWRNLEYLLMLGNNFKGPIPKSIAALENLTSLAINNLLGSPEAGFLFPEISKASYKALQFLTLRNCSLTDKIPDYIWKSSSLNYLDLSFNNLTEAIPDNVETPPQYIFLRRNKLKGSLPGWMLNSSNLFVDASENHFSNTTISGTTVENKNLFECCSEVDDYCANKSHDHLYINCGGNHISINGSLYEADLNTSGASTFFKSNNSAWAYSSMGAFSPLTIRPKSKYIMTTDSCNISAEDPFLYMTARVSPISLKYYGLCLKEDDYIVRLHFAEIGWDAKKAGDSGRKPSRVFDVEIQGQKKETDFNIEKEAEGVFKGITKQYIIPVNNSRLEIHLYWSGKGSMDSPTPYYGPLISAISVSPVPKKQRKNHTTVMISTIVGSVLLCNLMILGLCWMMGWLGVKRPDGVEVYPGGVFNFQQIKAATNDFSLDNKIGQGGFGPVYKGTLPNGTEIAVKQLSTKSKQGVREFMNEMGTIFALKHPNLVRLMGCCAEEHQLLLVYEYMENNSLGYALFGPEEVKARLDWKKRVKICLDVAKGLAYLHEECNLNLIHGDIKPTNILLDKDFNAKISDFGFAQPDEKGTTRKNARPEEGETIPIKTPIKGTQGYIAPECMKAKFSPKADVYSYGILTLEIISGQPSFTPSSRGQTVYLLEKAYDCVRKENPLGLLDPSLGSEYNPKEVKNIIYLAMMCINHDPDQRPTMSEVVKVLEGKKKVDNGNIIVPVAVHDLVGMAAFTQSTHTASTSFEGASDSTISLSTSKEIDELNLPVSVERE